MRRTVHHTYRGGVTAHVLTPQQHTLLDQWLPGHEVTADHSWPHGLTAVLELTHHGQRYIAKAGNLTDTHIAREVHAHRNWLTPWTSRARAPLLISADVGARLLLARFQPGVLVQGTVHADLEDTYRQAGELLALLHDQHARNDSQYVQRQKDKALAWLGRAHRIDSSTTARLHNEIESWQAQSAIVVPTHGDWQPRNWLIDRDRVSVIDFGRAELRPAYTDFARLDAQQFRGALHLEQAFLDGYGADPRQEPQWRYARIAEAIGTACWAYHVGDEAFEQQGHRMIAAALGT